MNKLRDFLTVLFAPSCWWQLNPYSEAWDLELTKLLAEHHFTKIGPHTAFLGERQIWIANHPYSSFYNYNGRNVAPRRITVLRAWRQLEEDSGRTEATEVEELERMLRRK